MREARKGVGTQQDYMVKEMNATAVILDLKGALYGGLYISFIKNILTQIKRMIMMKISQAILLLFFFQNQPASKTSHQAWVVMDQFCTKVLLSNQGFFSLGYPEPTFEGFYV